MSKNSYCFFLHVVVAMMLQPNKKLLRVKLLWKAINIILLQINMHFLGYLLFPSQLYAIQTIFVLTK